MLRRHLAQLLALMVTVAWPGVPLADNAASTVHDPEIPAPPGQRR